MTKKQRYEAARNTFDMLYPDAECSLQHADAWPLLVSAILATQCTDKRVNMVTPALFERYPDVYAFAEADELEVQGYIRSTGFYNNKAKNIVASARMLRDIYGGNVPDEIELLTALPGVGRKIANLVVGDIFGKPAVVVDTHAKRITYRLGLTKNTDPTKIEFDLRKIIPPQEGARFCHQLVLFGRDVCVARGPRCAECAMREWCNGVESK